MLSGLKSFIEKQREKAETERKRRFILVKAQVIKFCEDTDNMTDEINIPTFQRNDVKNFLQEIINKNQINQKYKLLVKYGLVA